MFNLIRSFISKFNINQSNLENLLASDNDTERRLGVKLTLKAISLSLNNELPSDLADLLKRALWKEQDSYRIYTYRILSVLFRSNTTESKGVLEWYFANIARQILLDIENRSELSEMKNRDKVICGVHLIYDVVKQMPIHELSVFPTIILVVVLTLFAPKGRTSDSDRSYAYAVLAKIAPNILVYVSPEERRNYERSIVIKWDLGPTPEALAKKVTKAALPHVISALIPDSGSDTVNKLMKIIVNVISHKLEIDFHVLNEELNKNDIITVGDPNLEYNRYLKLAKKEIFGITRQYPDGPKCTF